MFRYPKPSRRFYAISVLVLIVLLGAACNAAEPNAILFNPRQTDLGRIDIGANQEGTLGVLNNSDRPISVIRVTSSCGCTKAEIDREIMPPHTTAILSYTIETAGRSLGENYVQIGLSCRDQTGVLPEATTTISYNLAIALAGDLKCSVNGIYVRNIEPDAAPVVRYFVITGAKSCEEIKLSTNITEMRLGQPIPHKSGYIIPVAIKAPLGDIPSDGTIEVKCSNGAISIPVHLQRAPDIVIHPGKVILGPMAEASKGIRASVRVRTVRNINIERVESSLPGITASIENDEAAGSYRIVCNYIGDGPAPTQGVFTLTFVLKVDDKEVIREIPIVFY